MAKQGGARGRAETWCQWPAAVARRPSIALPHVLGDRARLVARQIHAWAAIEVGPGRLVPWLAIAFVGGVVVYFGIEREPEAWAAALLLIAAVAAAILLRARPFGFPLALGLA